MRCHQEISYPLWKCRAVCRSIQNVQIVRVTAWENVLGGEDRVLSAGNANNFNLKAQTWSVGHLLCSQTGQCFENVNYCCSTGLLSGENVQIDSWTGDQGNWGEERGGLVTVMASQLSAAGRKLEAAPVTSFSSESNKSIISLLTFICFTSVFNFIYLYLINFSTPISFWQLPCVIKGFTKDQSNFGNYYIGVGG